MAFFLDLLGEAFPFLLDLLRAASLTAFIYATLYFCPSALYLGLAEPLLCSLVISTN